MTRRLKMKDLERSTGVGRETIRFYIREGLLPEPERPGRNVAWYDESFVERLRLIKALQDKRYLPLAVIKTIVAGDACPTAAEVEALLAIDDRLAASAFDQTAGAPERLTALAKRTGLRAKQIREVAAVGLLRIETRDGDQWVDAPGVHMVELYARMRAAGFTEALGLGPERMRLHVDVIRMLAREELRLFTRAITGRVDAAEAARMAEEGITVIGEMLALLRRETLRRYVAEGNVPADEDAAGIGRVDPGAGAS